jgi:hypothetical protein
MEEISDALDNICDFADSLAAWICRLPRDRLVYSPFVGCSIGCIAYPARQWAAPRRLNQHTLAMPQSRFANQVAFLLLQLTNGGSKTCGEMLAWLFQ